MKQFYFLFSKAAGALHACRRLTAGALLLGLFSLGAAQKAQAQADPGQIRYVNGFTFYCADAHPLYTLTENSVATVVGFPATAIITNIPDSVDYEFYATPPGGGIPQPYPFRVPVTKINFSSYYNPDANRAVWEEIVIGNHIKEIGEYSFRNAVNLRSVVLPDGLQEIKDDVFKNCSSLQNINFPASLKRIGGSGHGGYYSAFENCTSLQSIDIPDSVVFIGSIVFRGCTALSSVNFNNPDSLVLETSAFAGCTSLTTLTIPKGVVSIQGAFYGCTSLQTVYYNAKKIDYVYSSSQYSTANPLFPDCPLLTNLYIGNDVEDIAAGSFRRLPLKNLYFPSSETLKNIGEAAFIYCEDMKGDIVIPASVETIGREAFWKSGLTNVTVRGVATKVGELAFTDCKALKSAVINGRLTGARVFDGCESLTSVTLSDAQDTIPSSTFSGCKSLESFNFPASTVFIGSNAFSGTGFTTFVVPDGIPSVESSTFSGCAKLKSITLPSSVQRIGAFAFNGCRALTDINIPEGVTVVQGFNYCDALEEVKLPSSVTTIGTSGSGFHYSGVKRIEIPESVNEFGYLAFWNCYQLKQVKVNWQTPYTGSNPFTGLSVSAITLIVPRGTAAAYKAADVWKYFRIVEDGEPVATPAENSAVISWYPESAAKGYALSVYKADSTLHGAYSLDAAGQVQTALALRSEADKLRYTVEGLSAASTYYYTLAMLTAGADTIARYDGRFATTGAAGLWRVNVSANNPAMGSVAGGGDYAANAQVTLSATPADGYRFTAWNDGLTDNPRIFTVTRDTAFTAVFEAETAPLFVAVTNIAGVPLTATAGVPLALTGTVTPDNATNKAIAWSVKTAGSTGATLDGVTLNVPASGTVVVTATIANGLTPATPYTQDFSIAVKEDTGVPAPSLAAVTADLLDYDLSPVVYDGFPHPVAVTPRSGVAGLGVMTVTYNGSAWPPVDKGVYIVAAVFEEGVAYAAGTVELGTLSIVAPVGVLGADAPASSVWASGGKLYIAAVSTGLAQVYALSGRLVASPACIAGETVQTDLPRGVYIVVAEGKSYKILAR